MPVETCWHDNKMIYCEETTIDKVDFMIDKSNVHENNQTVPILDFKGINEVTRHFQSGQSSPYQETTTRIILVLIKKLVADEKTPEATAVLDLPDKDTTLRKTAATYMQLTHTTQQILNHEETTGIILAQSELVKVIKSYRDFTSVLANQNRSFLSEKEGVLSGEINLLNHDKEALKTRAVNLEKETLAAIRSILKKAAAMQSNEERQHAYTSAFKASLNNSQGEVNKLSQEINRQADKENNLLHQVEHLLREAVARHPAPDTIKSTYTTPKPS